MESAGFVCSDRMAYVFTSFRGNGEDGLYLAVSDDGYQWQDLGRSFLAPAVGKGRLMRDPSLARGPNGRFHLVWTTGWNDDGFGVSHSSNLLDWSPAAYVPVMAHEPTVFNVWAPEITYDPSGDHFLIYWASTIPGRFPGDPASTNPKRLNNHRQYVTTTRDFVTYSPAQVFFEPGYSVIDAVLVPLPDRWALVFKDERDGNKRLQTAFSVSSSPLGPFETSSGLFAPFHSEGPTALRQGDASLVYFDRYTEKRYGAMATRDFQTWRDVSDQMVFPAGMRHGSVLAVSPDIVQNLRTAVAE